MAIDFNSEITCRNIYIRYYRYGNPDNISEEDMGKIKQAWQNKLSTWQAQVGDDENEYEFDDNDYTRYKSEGKEAAKDATGGYSGKNSGDIARAAIDVGGAAFGTTLSVAGNKIVGTVEGKAAKETATKSGKNALQNAKVWGIEAPLALALAVLYMAKKPNKGAKEACDALQPEMAGAQEALCSSQEEMESIAEKTTELADEATRCNDEANQKIEEEKTDYDMYMKTYLAIKTKVDNGEPITKSEQELYKTVTGYIQEIGSTIDDVSADTTDTVSGLNDEIATYQEGYDTVAETMGEIEGLTDYAEGFDSATRTLCYVESIAQGMNAASGTKAGIQAGLAATASAGFNVWAWACAAMGASAAVMSTIASYEQIKWAGEVGTEIDMRKTAQDLNTETMDIYDGEIDNFEGTIDGVNELELDIPKDVKPVEAANIPPRSQTPTASDTTQLKDDNKKEEK